MRLKPKFICVYLDRSGKAQYDLDNIAIAIIDAGYQGIKIDKRFSNGKHVHAFAGNTGTPEGVIMQELAAAFSREEPLPSPVQVLVRIKAAYALGGGND